MTRPLFVLGCLLCVLCPVFARASRHFFYSGSIGNYPVQLDLTIAGTSLFGDYSYLAFGETLKLTGTLDAQGSMLLLEQDARGKRSGRFTGNLSPDKLTFQGTWTSPDGKRKLAISFMALAEYHAVYARTAARNAFVGSYPRFFNTSPLLSQLNAVLEQQVTEKKNDQGCRQYNLRIACYQPQLAQLDLKKYDAMDTAHTVAVAYARATMRSRAATAPAEDRGLFRYRTGIFR